MDGAEYRGSWKAGARHGRGVMSRPDGYTYDGEWAEDTCHGHGSCRCEDGSRQGSLREHDPHLLLENVAQEGCAWTHVFHAHTGSDPFLKCRGNTDNHCE